jgi:hypothetical protein
VCRRQQVTDAAGGHVHIRRPSDFIAAATCHVAVVGSGARLWRLVLAGQVYAAGRIRGDASVLDRDIQNARKDRVRAEHSGRGSRLGVAVAECADPVPNLGLTNVADFAMSPLGLDM